MTIARSTARKLSVDAAKSGAAAVRGRLLKDGNRYILNQTDVTALLEELVDQNILLLIGVIDDEMEEHVRTCLTCGREYTGSECPHCARVRSRLRGG